MHESREYIKFPVINFNVCIYIIKIEINYKKSNAKLSQDNTPKNS